MGRTFVTLSREETEAGAGFWMRDGMLELWLRLLALHLPEPTPDGEHNATDAIRNQWLLASRGWFVGCVPHGLEEACATPEGRTVVRMAVESLLEALHRDATPLEASTLNLFGIEGEFVRNVERKWLIDVGHAFVDLLEGKITDTAASSALMPGSTPYQRP